jgi:hypothetical protein
MHRAGCRDRRPRRWASGTIMGFKSNALARYARTSPDPRRCCWPRALFSKLIRAAGNLTRTPSSALSRNPGWRNSDHFADCSNFEQSLLKMMTRRKRWSNTAASD